MSADLDVMVLGTGVAATTAATWIASGEQDVAIVDSRPYGGTCALRGCDPKKALYSVTDTLDTTKRLQGNGISDGAHIDWSDLMAFKQSFTRPVPKDREATFRHAGIETLHGRARFVDEATIEVNGNRYEAQQIVIATGATPRPLEMPGEDLIATSDEFLDWKTLPQELVFIGGGYVSFELAHIAARSGAEATVLNRSEDLLKVFDPDLVERLVEASQDAGITIETETPVEGVEEDGDRLIVRTQDGSEVPCEAVVHGAGRVPEIRDLDLDAGGIEHTPDGVTVDETLQSVSNERVYAAGDCADTPGWPLTPVAGLEGSVAASNVLDGAGTSPDYAGTVSVVFTIPPVARVGMSEDEAREENLEVEVHEAVMSDWFSHARLDHEPAASKVLIEEDTGRVLGAHLLGKGAPHTINLFALAIREGIPADRLRQVPYGYPTFASDLPHLA